MPLPSAGRPKGGQAGRPKGKRRPSRRRMWTIGRTRRPNGVQTRNGGRKRRPNNAQTQNSVRRRNLSGVQTRNCGRKRRPNSRQTRNSIQKCRRDRIRIPNPGGKRPPSGWGRDRRLESRRMDRQSSVPKGRRRSAALLKQRRNTGVVRFPPKIVPAQTVRAVRVQSFRAPSGREAKGPTPMERPGCGGLWSRYTAAAGRDMPCRPRGIRREGRSRRRGFPCFGLECSRPAFA